MPTLHEPKYLGDGVYASFDGYHINLAVNHHENHAVALEEAVVISLIDYASKVFKKPDPKPLPDQDTAIIEIIPDVSVPRIFTFVTRDVVTSTINFRHPTIITKEEALEIQRELGYHPHGYGFYSFQVDEAKEETTWNCANNCD